MTSWKLFCILKIYDRSFTTRIRHSVIIYQWFIYRLLVMFLIGVRKYLGIISNYWKTSSACQGYLFRYSYLTFWRKDKILLGFGVKKYFLLTKWINCKFYFWYLFWRKNFHLGCFSKFWYKFPILETQLIVRTCFICITEFFSSRRLF